MAIESGKNQCFPLNQAYGWIICLVLLPSAAFAGESSAASLSVIAGILSLLLCYIQFFWALFTAYEDTSVRSTAGALFVLFLVVLLATSKFAATPIFSVFWYAAGLLPGLFLLYFWKKREEYAVSDKDISFFQKMLIAIAVIVVITLGAGIAAVV